MTTYQDIREAVAATLIEESETLITDVADYLVDAYDLVGDRPADTFDSIDHDRYWEIVVALDSMD